MMMCVCVCPTYQFVSFFCILFLFRSFSLFYVSFPIDAKPIVPTIKALFCLFLSPSVYPPPSVSMINNYTQTYHKPSISTAKEDASSLRTRAFFSSIIQTRSNYTYSMHLAIYPNTNILWQYSTFISLLSLLPSWPCASSLFFIFSIFLRYRLPQRWCSCSLRLLSVRRCAQHY